MNAWVKGALKSKTMWFSAILAACGVIQSNSGLITTLLGAHAGSIILFVTAITVAVLRVVTTQSLPEKVQ